MHEHDHHDEHDTMTDEQLDIALAQMTEWRGEDDAMWKRALERADQSRGPFIDVIARIGHWPLRTKILSAAAAFLIVCGGVVALQTTPERRVSSAMPDLRNFAEADSMYSARSLPREAPASSSPQLDSVFFPWSSTQSGGGGGVGGGGGLLHDESPAAPDLAADRRVVRTITMQLATPDVRAAYLQAMHIVSAAHGEFIDASSISGEGEHARAEITLRIAVNRLDDALNRLRTLGDVVNEQRHGEDVTNQIIDLEARLRNEERIERELLELLDKRADSPLREVLELRQQIASVRQQVERYRAQVASLGKLTDLATVMVILRPGADTPDDSEDEDTSIGAYFGRSIGSAWHGGVRYLADTVAMALRILVGGMLWWVIASACIVIALRLRRTRMDMA